MVKAKSFIEKFYVAFIGFLLYAPLLVLFVCSFNDSKSRTVWGGFTLHWYTDLFQNEEVPVSYTHLTLPTNSLV